jgi:hypothetical protein
MEKEMIMKLLSMLIDGDAKTGSAVEWVYAAV